MVFDEEEEEVERANPGAENWTVGLSRQAKPEGSLPPAECCVSICEVFNVCPLLQCFP